MKLKRQHNCRWELHESKMVYNIAPSGFLDKAYLSELKESECVKHCRQFTFLFQQLDKKRAKLVFIMTNKRVALSQMSL